MALGQGLQFMKLAFCFTVLKVAVNASQRMAGDVHPPFTCGPEGIKHVINKTHGLDVQITCPKSSVKIDASTEIVCNVLSSTFAKITWFNDGQPISKQSKDHVTADWKTCNQTLKIKFAKTNDSGKYTCQVATTLETVSKTCDLNVTADKTKAIHIEYVKITGNRQKALLQGTVELKCSMLHVQMSSWLRNRTIIPKGGRYDIEGKPAFGNHGKNFYLRIINVTKDDEGPYTCLGNKNGLTNTKTFYLRTEPCPSGYFCPPDGNTAIPCPTTTYYNNEGENNSVSEEMKGCFKKENNPKTPASVRSRGSSFCSQGYMLTVIYTVMTFMWM